MKPSDILEFLNTHALPGKEEDSEPKKKETTKKVEPCKWNE